MIRLRIIAGIGGQLTKPHTRQGLGDERLKFRDVDLRATSGLASDDEVGANVADQAQLGIAMSDVGFPRTADGSPPVHEVGARHARIPTGRIHGGFRDATFTPCMFPNRRVEQPPRGNTDDEALGGFLKRRVVGNFREPQRFDERWAIRQMRDDAPIVSFQKALKD